MGTVELRPGDRKLLHAGLGGARYKAMAIARMVPCVCGTLPPREGGLHVRLSHRIVHHAMAKQPPLS